MPVIVQQKQQFQYLKTIIPLKLVGYEMVITNLTKNAPQWLCHLMFNAQS